MISPRHRRLLAGSAAALAAAAIGAGAAAPAANAEPIPYEIQTGAFPEAEYWLAGLDAAGQPQSGYFYANPILEGDEAVGAFRAILSVPSDTGITLSTADEHCVSDGTALICDYTDTEWGAEVPFELTTDGAVAVGADVEYTITVIADEYDPLYATDTWHFSAEDEGGWGAEFDVAESAFTDVAPGTVLTPEIVFANNESASYEGVYLIVDAEEQFLDIAAEYGNCGANEWGNVVCHLPDFTAEAGAVYELDPASPITIALTADAPGPMGLSGWASVVTDAYIEDIEFFDTDDELAFVESDRDTFEGSGHIGITTAAHAYDLAVADQELDAGATVLTIPVQNLGPATAFARFHPGSGEGDFGVSIQLPTGTSLGETQDGAIYGDDYTCVDPAQFGWLDQIDVADYGVERLDVQCWYYSPIAAGAAQEIELPVVVAAGAAASEDGRIVANLDTTGWDFTEFEENRDLSEADYPVLEADLANNTASLSLGAGSGSGQLPVTGSALTALLASAAAVLVAGVVLFAVLRRRKTAATW